VMSAPYPWGGVLSVEELCKAKEQTCMMSTCYDTVL